MQGRMGASTETLLTWAYAVATVWGALAFAGGSYPFLAPAAGTVAAVWALRTTFGSYCRPHQAKLRDQLVQLAAHCVAAAWEVRILWYGEGQAWWAGGTVAGCWARAPEGIAPISAEVWYLLVCQFCLWATLGFSCRFLEERSRDYPVMMAHHVTTVLLVAMAWTGSTWRSAVVCLFLHDVSDIAVDAMKVAYYLDLGGPARWYATEVLWGVNMLAWSFCRCWLFPLFVYEHIFTQMRVRAQGPAEIPWFVPVNGLLALLGVMHVYWCGLLLRVGYRAIWVGRGRETAAVGAQIYDRPRSIRLASEKYRISDKPTVAT
jgi:hypothetical protein